MEIINKKYLKIFFSFLFVVVVFFLLQHFAKSYIKNLIVKKVPPTISLRYADLDINILLGNIVLYDASFKIKSKDSLSYHTFVITEKMELTGISYYDILFNNKLSLKNINLQKPLLNYYPYKISSSKKDKKDPSNKELQSISIKEFKIVGGSLNVLKKDADSIQSSVSSINLTLLGSKINLENTEQFPVTYDRFDFNANKIILIKGDYETLKIDSVFTNKEALTINNFQIVPVYGAKELSKHLTKERDHIDLKIPQIVLEKLHFNFNRNRLGITVKSAILSKPNLEIYRDKLVADDATVKSLYSTSLRKLNFDLDIEKLKINQGYISYAELVDPKEKAGALFFNHVDADINHISNLKNTRNTDIKVKSKLMGTAPLTLNWSFDVNNTNDAFRINGSIMNLDAQTLNPFFKPNLNALAEGTLQQMYFKFYGNNKESKGDMKMKYEDFNFKILRKNSNKTNKFLTAIGNLFVKKDSKTKPQDFRHGDINAERDPTKSFFNYLWINVKNGIITTITDIEKNK